MSKSEICMNLKSKICVDLLVKRFLKFIRNSNAVSKCLPKAFGLPGFGAYQRQFWLLYCSWVFEIPFMEQGMQGVEGTRSDELLEFSEILKFS